MVNVTASGAGGGVGVADAAVPIASPPTDDHGGVQPTSNAMHNGITACFLAGTIAIALAVDDLGIVLKVVGATGSTTVSYILPGATYIRVCPRHLRGWQWWGALGMLLTGCAIMPLSLTLDFLSE
jgi:amino acid permease